MCMLMPCLVRMSSKSESEKSKESKLSSIKLYMPTLPFPLRFTNAKLDAQFGKFLDVLKSCIRTFLSLMLYLKCLCTPSF